MVGEEDTCMGWYHIHYCLLVLILDNSKDSLRTIDSNSLCCTSVYTCMSLSLCSLDDAEETYSNEV